VGTGGAYTPPSARAAAGPRTVPGAPPPNGSASNGRAKRTVPGAAAPANGASSASVPATPEKASRRKGKKGANASTTASPAQVETAPESSDPIIGAADVGGSGGVEKKLRNLNKKLKAIQDLKDKQARGEKLEQTQVAKIASEQEVLSELAALQ